MPRPRWPLPLTAGFRLFFPLAAITAFAVMVRTLLLLQGGGMPAGNPFVWHGHEMVFGYVAATIAGFILTAVPNWTGTRPASGLPLLLLLALWLIARAGLWSGQPPWWAAAADIAFLPAAALVAARPLWRGGDLRRWLPVGVIVALGGANALWHAGAVMDTPALSARALALTTLLLALLIAIIGGRVIPVFTRNRLQAWHEPTPLRPAGIRDGLAIGASALVVIAEPAAPALVAWLALVAAVLHGARLHGWCGLRTWRDPLLLVLHVGYGWLVLGYAIRGLALLGPPWSGPWDLHGLLTGAVGTMTLAIMSRATLGHTGRALRAGGLLTAAFLAIQGAAVARLLGPIAGPEAWRVAGCLWSLAFALFLLRCGPMLCGRARVTEPVKA